MRVLHLLVVAALGVVALSEVVPGYKGMPPMWKKLSALPREARVEVVKTMMNDEQRGVLEDQFTAIIYAILGSPNMDPLEIAHVNINVHQTFATMEGTLDAVTATGLSAMEVTNMKINPLFFKGELGFALPAFHSQGYYDFNAVFAGLLPIYGKGGFVLDLENFSININIQLGTSLSGGFFIKTLVLDMGLTGFHANFEMLLGDAGLSLVVNEMINDLAMDFFSKFKVEIETAIANNIIRWFNGDGTTPPTATIAEVMEAIRNFPGVQPMAECKPLARGECKPLH